MMMKIGVLVVHHSLRQFSTRKQRILKNHRKNDEASKQRETCFEIPAKEARIRRLDSCE